MAKAQAQEPSMEEILASIRRIIADEEAAPKGASQPEADLDGGETISEDDLDKLFASAGKDEEEPVAPEIAAAAEEDEEILDLTEAQIVDDPPLVEGMGEDSDLAFEDRSEEHTSELQSH